MPSKFTKDFKETIVELYKSGKTAPELSREYGVSTQLIYLWVKESKKSIDDVMESEELKALRKEVQQLKIENEILKKATAIFAKKV